MNRRFVNLLVNRLCAPRPAYRLHCIDPATLFYPTGSPQPADPAAINDSAPAPGRLPAPTISFDWPCKPHQSGWMDFMAFKNNIIAVDHEGRTLLYDTASRAVRAMPQTKKPNSRTISFTVGDGLYVMARENGSPPHSHYFQALIYGRPPGFLHPEDWHWRPLQQPDFDFPDNGDVPSNHKPGEAVNPYGFSAFTVYDDSQIWMSTVAAGIYSYNTVSGTWSKVHVSALPFRGRAEYVPEHGLWFGFSREDEQLCASDLAQARPVLQKVWEEPAPPERCSLMASHILPLGSGKLCVARLFQKTERGTLHPSGYTKAEHFAVLSGVEVFRAGNTGSLETIKHKSKRYSFGNDEVKLI
ncbi:hypothetical protein CFC21_015484 [Triticum aestivum]|uniref:Uncharacterized protein n=3 Tax=Triticum TaxID=4564 RepID=A0A9R1R372_TRITD|nr:uncharacterized protein LOC119358986 [Triticum dicoccoides]XP_044452763.1 uncharacterized protein LOC123184763 [Triticum aestivum]KAF6999457.1 hypothetical protein CFC21_015484 [Triticum aestivum]VAH26612.1 unnamed protein product [Triticum turgidum subsp. durum]